MKPVRTVLIAAVLCVGGYFAWQATHRPAPPAPESPAVPVSVADAKAGEAPVYLTTIGNVVALSSVEIRAQVGGELVSVPVKEGDRVKKGQTLGVIDPRPYKAALDKAQAQVVQDQAQLQNAELDRQRYATLARSDFASRQQLDTQVAAVGRLQGAVQADQASITSAQINLDFTILSSPIDGRVGLRRVDPGNLIQANSSGPGVFLVVQEQPISVIFSMPETDLPAIQDAMQKGPLTALAVSSQDGRVLSKGQLETTNNAVDTSSGTIQMRANFPNENRTLVPGQFVDVRLQVDIAKGVIVPHLAIQHGGQGLFVFTVMPDKTIKQQDVKVAYDDGTIAVVPDGLPAGTMVVTAGQTRIGAGTKVAFNEPGASTASNSPAAQQESAAR